VISFREQNKATAPASVGVVASVAGHITVAAVTIAGKSPGYILLNLEVKLQLGD